MKTLLSNEKLASIAREDAWHRLFLQNRLHKTLMLLWTGKLADSQLKGYFEQLMTDFIDTYRLHAGHYSIIDLLGQGGRMLYGLTLKFTSQLRHKALEVW